MDFGVQSERMSRMLMPHDTAVLHPGGASIIPDRHGIENGKALSKGANRCVPFR